jgi:hypothetical protein
MVIAVRSRGNLVALRLLRTLWVLAMTVKIAASIENRSIQVKVSCSLLFAAGYP